jgi:hypothetical protein
MKKLSILTLLISLLLTACYYNNFTEIHPGQDLNFECDSNAATVTFQKTIQPILSANCGSNNSCHNASSSNPRLDTYESVKTVAADGRLVKVINWEPGAAQMPKSASTKIPRCARAQIEVWVANGFLDN